MSIISVPNCLFLDAHRCGEQRVCRNQLPQVGNVHCSLTPTDTTTCIFNVFKTDGNGNILLLYFFFLGGGGEGGGPKCVYRMAKRV